MESLGGATEQWQRGSEQWQWGSTVLQGSVQADSPRLALNPLRQVVPHLDGKVMPIESLHLPQGFTLKLLRLDPHRHGSPPAGTHHQHHAGTPHRAPPEHPKGTGGISALRHHSVLGKAIGELAGIHECLCCLGHSAAISLCCTTDSQSGKRGLGLARSPAVNRAEQPQQPQQRRFWMQAHSPGIPTGREQPRTQQTEPGLQRDGTYPVPDLSPTPHPTQEEEQ